MKAKQELFPSGIRDFKTAPFGITIGATIMAIASLPNSHPRDYGLLMFGTAGSADLLGGIEKRKFPLEMK